MLNDIIKKNQEINELIKKIIDERKKMGLSIDEEYEIPGKIFKAELNRCIGIYEMEFQKCKCLGKREFSFVTQKETADCYGGLNGLQVSKGMQKFINEVVKTTMARLGYSIQNDGEVYFDENGNTENLPTPSTYLNTKYDGSLKDQMDYFAYLYSKDGIDMDWVIDALPHEAMHTFGIIGGMEFLKEGTTEQLTREVCEKYGIHMAASSHTQEANLVKKLELIVGRSEIVSAGRYNKHREKLDEDLKNLSREKDIPIQDLEKAFQLFRYDEEKRTDEDNSFLQSIMRTYQLDKTFENIRIAYDNGNMVDRYKFMAIKFEENLGLEKGTFNKFLSVLDAIYRIQMKHKTNPFFYRKLYSKDWNETLTDDEYIEIMRSLGIDESQLESIKENGFNVFGNGKRVNSFLQLTEPIDDYIKDNNLDANVDRAPNDNTDYTKLESTLDAEIKMLTDVLDKIRFSQDGKKGLADCIDDDMVRTSLVQEATRAVKQPTITNKENSQLEENGEAKIYDK